MIQARNSGPINKLLYSRERLVYCHISKKWGVLEFITFDEIRKTVI